MRVSEDSGRADTVVIADTGGGEVREFRTVVRTDRFDTHPFVPSREGIRLGNRRRRERTEGEADAPGLGEETEGSLHSGGDKVFFQAMGRVDGLSEGGLRSSYGISKTDRRGWQSSEYDESREEDSGENIG